MAEREQLLVRLIHHWMQCTWCLFELRIGKPVPQLCPNAERLWRDAQVPALPDFEAVPVEDHPSHPPKQLSSDHTVPQPWPPSKLQ